MSAALLVIDVQEDFFTDSNDPVFYVKKHIA